jgi:predicted SprT family Zn-dependent metalloprotease
MKLNEVQALAISLMDQYGLLDKGWYFKFNNRKTSFGVCKGRKKAIELSKPLCELNGLYEVNDVILHEIAHALVGVKQGHNDVWKRKCIEIGAKPERCYSSERVNTPQLRYVATCGGCGKIHDKARKPNPITKIACLCQNGKAWSEKIVLNFVDTKFGY